MTKISNIPYIIEFNSIGSEDIGYVTVAQYRDKVPFEIKRVYWTCHTPVDVMRGMHANKELEIILIAVAGKISVHTESINGIKIKFVLETPYSGLYIPVLHWRTITYSPDAIQLCLASMEFNESDYIRNYEDFKKNKDRHGSTPR